MIKLKTSDLKRGGIKNLVIPVCEDLKIHDNRTIQAIIKDARKLDEFKGKTDDVVTFYSPSQAKADRVILMGIGPKEKLNAEIMRVFAGKAVKRAIKKGLDEVMLVVPSDKKTGLPMEDLLKALMEGAYLGNHLFDRFKEDKKHRPLEAISLKVKTQTAKKFAYLAEKVEIVCQGSTLAREWVSLPSNHKQPPSYADAIAEQAKTAGLIIRIMDEKMLERKGFGAVMAVGQGSEAKPRLVVLEYRSPGAEQTLALVGKGVTFDSGGLNIKVGGNQSGMKSDMAGSAAVAAALISTARLKPAINVVGVIPIVENMPSGTAIRPGDIIRTYSGKTVEIGNTDAEGRLILIDAISYAIDQFKPDMLIDMATLTGACVVALGEKIAGVFSRDEELAGAIIASGEKTHERCWRMPLPEDYRELLKSDFADLSNMSSSRWGGAITAALFISAFAEKTRWAHVDIAGPAFGKKEAAYCGPGGSGFGVRLLCDFIENLSK